MLDCTYALRCDNQQTIRIVTGEGERLKTKLRHIDIHQLWARQEYQKGSFEVTYLPTNEMPADGFTKALSRQKFEHFRALLCMEPVLREHMKLAETITEN